MRNQEIVNYLNSIDFSLVEEDSVITNIYNEIVPFSSTISLDPFASTSLEKLIFLSKPSHLILFVKSLSKSVIYKKLGSRVVESIFKRLFECMYIKNDPFYLKDAVQFINVGDCIMCPNATHALRQALMLLSGKRVEKMSIKKYKIADPEERNEAIDPTQKNNSDHKSVENAGNEDICHDKPRESNSEYSKRKLMHYKQILLSKVHSLENNDSFNTLGIFLQVTKSQSLIQEIIECDCSQENIEKRGFFYEILPTIASSANLKLLYNKFKDSVMELCMSDKSSYFIQSFLRNSKFGSLIYQKIELDKFDPDSNVVLSLLESLQGEKEFLLVDKLIKEFYEIESCVFKSLLLEKHDGLDTKYIKAITNFMLFPKNQDYKVNSDFVKYFQKDWVNSKAGISLIVGFAGGSADAKHKKDFFRKNIDLCWNAHKWKEGRDFMKKVVEYTDGHSRKKAYEILNKCTNS